MQESVWEQGARGGRLGEATTKQNTMNVPMCKLQAERMPQRRSMVSSPLIDRARPRALNYLDKCTRTWVDTVRGCRIHALGQSLNISKSLASSRMPRALRCAVRDLVIVGARWSIDSLAFRFRDNSRIRGRSQIANQFYINDRKMFISAQSICGRLSDK